MSVDDDAYGGSLIASPARRWMMDPSGYLGSPGQPQPVGYGENPLYPAAPPIRLASKPVGYSLHLVKIPSSSQA
jgi:hypothetical protein